jgi:hypothetical protein
MKFDKSRCYSALNADELRVGDKVVVADNLADLMEFVRKNDVHEIEDILSEKCSERFGVCGMANYALAYLVERRENCTNCGARWVCPLNAPGNPSITRCNAYEPLKLKTEKHTDYNHCEEARKACVCAMTNVCPEKHYRPFKDTDELIKVWDAKIGTPNWGADGDLTMPLIWVRNKSDKKVWLINEFDKRILDYLFTNCEFLDGSVCGVEE